MRRGSKLAVLLLVVLAGARAQDERRVASPDGRLEFRLFVAQPQAGGLSRLAYRVLWRGQPVIDTSFLGLNIHDQEPLLGENDGLVSARQREGAGYRELTADYMQNGSIGRLIHIEARVWNDGLAFRYVIPRSTALDDILIEDEATDFDLGPRPGREILSLPFVAERPGVGWIGIGEVPVAGFPRMVLSRGEGGVVTAHLERATADPLVAFAGHTPLVCPWRVVTIAAARERALHPLLPANLAP